MSNVLPVLGLIVPVAIIVTGVTVARRRGVSSLRIYVEMIALVLGGALALLPCGCFGLAGGLATAFNPYTRSRAWLDVVPVIAFGAGAVFALCRVSPPGGRTALPAAMVALAGFAAATGASFGVWFLVQNTWGAGCLVLLALLAIALATVGSYAMAIGAH